MSGRDAEERPPEELVAQAVGAVLFASGEPVQPRELAAAFGDMPLAEIDAAVETLNAIHEREGTGLRVEKIAGGYRFATQPAVGAWVRRFFRQRNRTRLSPAALETLAIVAYKQPVTSPEIQSIRGKDPSAALKILLDKKLVRLLGRKKVVGNPLLYGTSRQFLVHFGLDSLEDLPSIEDFDEFVGVLESGQGGLFGGEAGDEAEAAADDAGDDEASLEAAPDESVDEPDGEPDAETGAPDDDDGGEAPARWNA